MKKKLLAMVSTMLVGTLLLTACGGGGSDTETTTTDTAASEETDAGDDSSASSSDIKIGMIVNDGSADTYQTTYYTAAQEYAEELGVEIQLLDPKGDVATQANQVQDLINMNCDVIVIWPVNSESAVSSVKAVDDAGIPCLVANTPVVEEGLEYTVGFVGPSNVEEGKQSAQAMVDALGEGAKIVEITGQSGYSTTTERSSGMKEAVEAGGLEILDSQPGDGKRETSQQVMENFLVKYAVGEVDAVFCFDDNTAFGAINAIEAVGREGDVKVYAAAAGDFSTVEYVREGRLSGIAMQSPIIDAQTTLDFAVKVANGEEIEFYNYIETPVATPDNIDTLEIEEW